MAGQLRDMFACLCLAVLAPLGAAAQTEGRNAWLLGPDTSELAPLSQALLTGGYGVTRRAWDGAGEMPLPTSTDGRLVIYVTGTLDGAAVAEAVAALPSGDVLLVTDTCLPDMPSGIATLSPEREADGPGCASLDGQLDTVLIAALDDPGMSLADMDLPGGAALSGRVLGPLVPAEMAPVRTPVVIGRAAATTALVPVTRTATQSVSLTPGGGLVPVRAVATVGAPAALGVARATPEGLPRPSIIVGLVRSAPDDSEAVDEGILGGAPLAADTYDARERLRASDPDGYVRLVGAGAFDPDPPALAASLQRALQRMDCYGLRIDGDWGNGSRRAVDRYYDVRGGTAPTRDAEIALFRDIILREDVTCPPPPAPVATARSTPTRTTTPRATAARQVAPARQAPAAAPAATAPAATGRISPTFSGAFR